MITIRKLASLTPGTRRRKIARLLEGFQREARLPDSAYFAGLLGLLRDDDGLPQTVRSAARSADPTDAAAIDALRHALLAGLGMEPADWDLLPPAGYAGPSDDHPAVLASVELFLDAVRSPFNVGSMVRTAAAFGLERVRLGPGCPRPDHPRLLRSAMGAGRMVEVVCGPLDAQADVPVLVLEIGGTPIEFVHFPSRGILVVGSEEHGVSEGIRAKATARLSIPLGGPKATLNVGVACAIALYAWRSALRNDTTGPPAARGPCGGST